MEEEAQRVAMGEVPDDIPNVVMEKDATPSSINAIFSSPVFSPPINQFELSENTSPKLFSLDDTGNSDMYIHNETESALTPASEPSPVKDKEEPMEGTEAPLEGTKAPLEGFEAPLERFEAPLRGFENPMEGFEAHLKGFEAPMQGTEAAMIPPPHDSDSDEGIAVGAAEGAAVTTTQEFNPHDAPTPTAEEVDAALAELDSIPDGVCESGEVEEEEEDEEEWSYYRMEPQTQPQGEDVLIGGVTSAAVAPPPTEDIEILSEPSAMVQDQDIVPVHEDHTKDTTQDQAPAPEQFEEQNVDFLGNLSDNQPKNELLDNIEEKKDICPDMEADEAPLVVRKTPDILESDMDMIPSLDDHPERIINFSAPDIEKTPGFMEGGFEPSSPHGSGPSSPHGSGSPHIPGSPRSVEGFVTSVELNTPDESFATNFSVNQTQDLFAGVVDQTSGPFSVYVSSSPEPTSMDPPSQAPVDLLNMSGGMTNGQMEEELASLNQTPQAREDSPVEIVHAQSTVEVVAPPSPVDVSGPETQFIIPDQVPNSPTSAQMPLSDISFVPQPVMEPTAEVPVPVYVDDTPVSEPDIVPDVDHVVKESAFDIMTMSQTADELMLDSKMQVDSNESFVNLESTATELTSHSESVIESSRVETSEMISNVQSMTEAFTHVESTAETFSHLESTAETLSHVESTTETKLDEVCPVPALSPIEAAPAPIESSPLPTVVTDHVTSSPVDAVSPPIDTEVISAPVVDIPEKAPKLAKSQVGDVKTPTKTKTPAKTAADKTPARATPGKATPSRATPGKATPTRTPSTKTPSTKTPTRTPITKSTEKRTPTARTTTPSTSKPATPKPPTTKPATTRPASTKSAAPKAAPSTRPAPTKTSTTRAPVSASKPAERSTTRPAGATASKTASSRPTGAAAKPTTTRPTPTARTTTTAAARKPTTTTKSTDKADGSKLVNGTSSRPSSRPTTAKSTTSTTTRKPLSSSASRTGAKAAAEKETKNTTNQILSTSRPSKTPSPSTRITATKTSSAHSTSRTMSKANESSNTAKSRVTSTTRSTASKTTGAATKKTLVSKTKTSQSGAKETSVKVKTEAAVIETTEPLVNGENKIADEETSVEVIEKCAVEDIMQASSEKVLTETMTSSEQVMVTTETTEVLVNGDH